MKVENDGQTAYDCVYSQPWFNEYQKMTEYEQVDYDKYIVMTLGMTLFWIFVSLYSFGAVVAFVVAIGGLGITYYWKWEDHKEWKNSRKKLEKAKPFVIQNAFRDVKIGTDPIVFDEVYYRKMNKLVGKKNDGKVFRASLFDFDYEFAEHEGKWYSKLTTLNEPWISSSPVISICAAYDRHFKKEVSNNE